ncbi:MULTISPECIES: LuxR C-terminal-related transcriptional regulator [unclassified Oceanobacter]|jgi:LuxR family transcriptional regulator of csgAB operon|uniref:LuxR C-terminal-related transcriptional regulator n=1 Tax=unclassified Oceanobacter TaxID=2620260 RepID=UPI002736F20F|nr:MULTISPECIES: LuxR C-terminal-related transcriptional regulator [unclassified Oceanobacter]MDP2506015.1 LuxR C-terminal-related transcriptional regulator [Oceanobacter sp. 3_MG-2023]MDP2547594.1 LuxR C-terminal-related transcriptional regulator [Oceanobacter sp. 4_MG-2023]MDP2608968.1 LuxR C-terminal-related transcriptional regulator [Oceanobacter sp. 1_MG-2023]MDP2612047.1 LuxR C-terminal-related transcriptional regulator [Oceanobacter sp. 2_MG-2023]
MDRQYSTDRRYILLFGRQNLQNAILLDYIQTHLGLHAQLVHKLAWPPAHFPADGQTLLMFDTDGVRPERLARILDEIYEADAVSLIGLFNVPEHHALEEFICWPRVSALFYRHTSQSLLLEGIKAVFNGELWLPRKLVNDHLERTRQRPRALEPPPVSLTGREAEILHLVETGATNQDIADALEVSTHTIKTHLYNLFKKIGVKNRVQAINWAKEHLSSITV